MNNYFGLLAEIQFILHLFLIHNPGNGISQDNE